MRDGFCENANVIHILRCYLFLNDAVIAKWFWKGPPHHIFYINRKDFDLLKPELVKSILLYQKRKCVRTHCHETADLVPLRESFYY